MINRTTEKFKNRRSFFLVLLLIISSGSANKISYGAGVTTIIGLLLLSYVFFIKRGKKLSNLVIPLAVVFVFLLGYLYKYNTFDLGFLARFFSYVTIPYCVLLLVGKKRFFTIYVRVMVFLVITAFPFYVYQLIDPFGLFNLLKPIETFFGLGKFAGTVDAGAGVNYVNVIFYTVNTLYPDIFHRSLGFAFEPGFYSIFIVLAIFFNIVINNRILNIAGAILILGLITTFSTTGFLAFFIVLIYYFYKGSRIKYSKYFLPILIPFLIFVFINTSFLSQKIIDAYQGLGQLNLTEIGYNQRFTAGRFLGFKVGLYNFQLNPLIGFGDYGDGEYFKKTFNSNVGIINGIANYLATLGGLGVLFLLIAFKKTYRQLRLLYGNITVPLSILLLTVSFSFAFPLTPLFGVFMVYFLVPSMNQPNER